MSHPCDPEKSDTAVAIIGLGAMGGRLAGRLQDVGRSVIVWNRSTAAAEPLVRRGAFAATSPADAATRADAVIVMVSDPAVLRSISNGNDGLLAGAHPGLLVIVMSTVGPAAVIELADALPASVDLLDAPVLGSLAEVEQGQLQIFVGGSDAATQRAEPLLRQLGTPLRVGDVGDGSAAKLVANLALLGTLTVLGESVAFADTLGLSRQCTFDVLASTPLAEQVTRRRAALDGLPFATRYRLSLARKDADLMLASSTADQSSQRLLPSVKAWLMDAEDQGHGDQDYLAMLTTILDAVGGRVAR